MSKVNPWLVHLRSLHNGENKLALEVDIEDLGGTVREVAENPLFEALLGPLAARLLIVKSGRGIMVKGKVEFEARLRCAICGRLYESSFCEDLSCEFVSEEEREIVEKELNGAELEQEWLQGDILNLARPLRDTIHLAIPIAPVCGQECEVE